MKKLFVLIWIHRGLIQAPELFFSKKTANLRLREIRCDFFNEEYDEVEIFEKSLVKK